MPGENTQVKESDNKENTGTTEWQVEDFLFGESSIPDGDKVSDKKEGEGKVDNSTIKVEGTEGGTKEGNKGENKEGETGEGGKTDSEVSLIDQVKDKTHEEIDVIVDTEVNKRLEGTTKTKEEIVAEITGELSGNKEDVDFTPFFDLLHKELGYKDLADENKPNNSIKGFVDHIKSIIDSNSRPEYSSDIVKKFDDYVRSGYDPQKYLEQIYGEPDYEKMKVETESEQKAMLDHYLRVKNPDWDGVKRTEKINRLETAGLLEDESKEAHEELKKLFANREQRVEQEQQKEETLKAQRLEDWQRKLHSDIFSQQNIAGFDFPEQEKKGLFEFITKTNEEGVTEYNKRLVDPVERLKLAYFAFKGLDKKKFDSSVETDITQKLMKSLSRFSDTSKAGGGQAGVDADFAEKPGSTNYEAFIIN